MILQTRFSSKAFVASSKSALEWFESRRTVPFQVFIVMRQLVFSEVSQLAKFLRANITCIWLLSCVHSNMAFKQALI